MVVWGPRRRQAGAGARGSVSIVNINNEATVMRDVLRETLMGVRGQGESADTILSVMSLVVPKEKEFPIETIRGRPFVLLGRHNRLVHRELLYSFYDAKCLGVGWTVKRFG